jgi:Ca-activated chloride channel family protein
VLVERVGATDVNQAIAALSASRRSGGAQIDLFVAVANPSTADAARRLEIYADGQLVEARDLSIPAGQRSEALVGTVPPTAGIVEARLAGTDALAVDDRAFALVAPEETVRALVVGPGNSFLENALALLPRLELFAVSEAGYEDAMAEAAEDGAPYGLIVYDGVVPAEDVGVPSLYLDPDTDGPFGEVAGRIEAPVIDRPDPDEPLLRFVDLGSVHIGRARSIEPAPDLRAVVATPAGSPLVGVGQDDGRRIALIGFDLGESDLPLQVAFPLLMSNLVEHLVPAGDGILPSSMRLGQPVTARVDEAIQRVRVTTSGGPEDVASAEYPVRDGQLSLPGADVVGVRDIVAVSDDAGLDGTRIGQTAVNLFSADESDIAPGDPMRIVDMGRVPDDRGASAQPARSEWWWPLALAALVLLAVEWLLFHRPTRRSLARLVARRPQPLGGRAR